MTRTETGPCDHSLALKDDEDDYRIIYASDLLRDKSVVECIKSFNFCPDCGIELGSTFAKWKGLNQSAFYEIANLEFKQYPDIEAKRAQYERQIRDDIRVEKSRQIGAIRKHYENLLLTLEESFSTPSTTDQEPTP